MTRYVITCEECGWTTKPAKSQRAAEYALRKHSCEKQQLRAASRARREAREAAVDRTPKPCLHKHANHQHGTHAKYVLDRCRCLACSRANTEYEDNRARQQAYGRWNGLIDAEPARRHVHELMAAGMGLKRIAKAARVSTGSLSKLIYGVHGGVPSRRVKPATAERLLAVQLDLADGVRVDSTGTARRIQALVALGYSMNRISDELGIQRQNFTATAHGRHDVSVATARAVRGLYDRWSMTPPTPTEWREKISVARSRKLARIYGWAPPLAWDDETIDDSNAGPQFGDIEYRRGPASKLPPAEDVVWLLEAGESLETIADRFSLKVASVERTLTRAGHHELVGRLKAERAAAA